MECLLYLHTLSFHIQQKRNLIEFDLILSRAPNEKSKMRTRQKQCIATPGDPWGVKQKCKNELYNEIRKLLMKDFQSSYQGTGILKVIAHNL